MESQRTLRSWQTRLETKLRTEIQVLVYAILIARCGGVLPSVRNIRAVTHGLFPKPGSPGKASSFRYGPQSYQQNPTRPLANVYNLTGEALIRISHLSTGLQYQHGHLEFITPLIAAKQFSILSIPSHRKLCLLMSPKVTEPLGLLSRNAGMQPDPIGAPLIEVRPLHSHKHSQHYLLPTSATRPSLSCLRTSSPH